MSENEVKITNKREVSQYIPDFLQETIIKKMDDIDEQIHYHEEAIKQLNKLYVAHANFLQQYSPFEQRDLSQDQDCSLNMIESPEAVPQAERRDENEETKAQDVLTASQS